MGSGRRKTILRSCGWRLRLGTGSLCLSTWRDLGVTIGGKWCKGLLSIDNIYLPT